MAVLAVNMQQKRFLLLLASSAVLRCCDKSRWNISHLQSSSPNAFALPLPDAVLAKLLYSLLELF